MHKAVVAVLNDLMFQVKIQEITKRTGLSALFVTSQSEALSLVEQQPAAVVIDLNFASIDPLALVETLKASEQTRSIPVIGYFSHVQTELRQAAVERGCDFVLARSAFVQRLGEILAQQAHEQRTVSDGQAAVDKLPH